MTAQEYAELVRLFSEGLPLESQGRVRNVTLIGVNHIAALCAKKGRDEKSIALLRGLSVELPRLWQLQLQAEEHAANQEVDLLLGDAIAEEEELETSLFAELHHMASFQEDTEDEQKVQNLALSPVPASVQAELKAYTDCAPSPSPPLAFVAVSRVCPLPRRSPGAAQSHARRKLRRRVHGLERRADLQAAVGVAQERARRGPGARERLRQRAARPLGRGVREGAAGGA